MGLTVSPAGGGGGGGAPSGPAGGDLAGTYPDPTAPGKLSIPLAVKEADAAAYTLVLSDAWKLVCLDFTDGQAITIPPNSDVAFPIGTLIWGMANTPWGWVAGAGVTLLVPSNGANQYLSAGEFSVLYKIDTDTWQANYTAWNTLLGVIGALNGLLKVDGSKTAQGFKVATPGTDYLAPNGDGSALSGVAKPADITLAAIQTAVSITPFTGSGAFTNLNIVDGFITSAS